MKYDVDSFGKNLKYYMVKRDVSGQELAEKMYVNAKQISAWRHGRHIPLMDNLVRLAEVLDVSLDELFTKNERK